LGGPEIWPLDNFGEFFYVLGELTKSEYFPRHCQAPDKNNSLKIFYVECCSNSKLLGKAAHSRSHKLKNPWMIAHTMILAFSQLGSI
jgi:hypothetical protein